MLVVTPCLAGNNAAVHCSLYEILNLFLNFQAKLLLDQALENVAVERAAKKLFEILFLALEPVHLIGDKGGTLTRIRQGFAGLLIC